MASEPKGKCDRCNMMSYCKCNLCLSNELCKECCEKSDQKLCSACEQWKNFQDKPPDSTFQNYKRNKNAIMGTINYGSGPKPITINFNETMDRQDRKRKFDNQEEDEEMIVNMIHGRPTQVD